jgi:hypothetical protein
MTLDLLDAAFVARWRAVAATTPPEPGRVVEQIPCVGPVRGHAAAEQPVGDADQPQDMPQPVPPDAPLVERLLRAAPEEWLGLAGHVERARQRGRRVIAVAGCERGEGRTTLVECLAAALRARGCEVTCVEPADAAGIGGVPHDKRIVLVDAGIWFPPGPVRRQRLMVASLGCEAAILVRRADRPSIGPRAAVLIGLGIEVLGEVMTFTPSFAAPSAARAPADATLLSTGLSPTRETSPCVTRA